MSSITGALEAARAQLAGHLGTDAAVLIHHPAYNADAITNALEAVNKRPVVVLFQMTHQEIVYGKKTLKGGGVMRWEIAALVYLHESASAPLPVLSDSGAVKSAIGKHDAWFDLMAGALESDRTLGGAVLALGDDEALFRALVGELPWNRGNYWGIQFAIPVRQVR